MATTQGDWPLVVSTGGHNTAKGSGRNSPSQFQLAGWTGATTALAEGLIDRLDDLANPASALRTLHWGRNYLYVVGPLSPPPETARHAPPTVAPPIVVKQFREQGTSARAKRRWRGESKAQRSFAAALEVQAAGVGTPRPLLWAERQPPDGVSIYVSELIENAVEARYLIRALRSGMFELDFPDLEVGEVFSLIGATARHLHDAGVRHRDFSIGNLLLRRDAGKLRLWIVDLNRARWGQKLGDFARLRDLSRLPLPTEPARREFWRGYFGGGKGVRRGLEWWGPSWHRLSEGLFRFRNVGKRGARGLGRGLTRRISDFLLPRRGSHAHLPAPSKESSIRDRVVWDSLSDQPHQHASRAQKTWIRLLDSPRHLVFVASAITAGLRARRRYRELLREVSTSPARVQAAGNGAMGEPRRRSEVVAANPPLGAFGVGVLPQSAPLQELLELFAELAVPEVLMRLAPWEAEDDLALGLAEELSRLGTRLTFVVPQNRDLVLDPKRWRRRVRQIAEQFAPLGNRFQVGQAINRSKWGIWRPEEYATLLRIATEELRAVDSRVEIIGPAVIDFEPLATLGFANARSLGASFDGLASLLYVDRRGAPENEQLGFDAGKKSLLMRAIAETGRNLRSSRSYITEVNWPLREGPHSPAGREVAVSEEDQARYLARFYLLALARGRAEGVFWWQLVARGYGLVDRAAGCLRRRAAFFALQRLHRELGGATYEGALGIAGLGQHLLRFRCANGETVVAGWCHNADTPGPPVELPSSPRSAVSLLGEPVEVSGCRVWLSGAVTYFRW